MKSLIPLSILFALLIFISPALAESDSATPDAEMPSAEESISDEASSIQTVRRLRKNPCLGMIGTELRKCVQSLKRNVKNTESRRTQVMKSESSGRRLAAIQNRLKNRISVLDSPANPGEKVNLMERVLYRRNLLRERGSEHSYAGIKEGPLVRVRTKTGGRDTASSLPVCSRRDGLRLIRCMQELGVEINEETVDADTWKIYKRIYTR